jgi:hypothetical protein
MPNILKFRYPDKKPHDPLLRSDPMPDFLGLNPDARLIYLRIIDESDPGVLLRCDQLMVAITAQMVAIALLATGGGEFVDSIEESFEQLLAPDLGREYITQIMRNG